jgi:hypothetical protein
MFEINWKIISRGFLSVSIAIIVASCGREPVTGLIPKYPPVKVKSFSLFSEFVEVDSLRPTFQWQPFLPSAIAPFKEIAITEAIENITYELRIWRTAAGELSKLVYERRDLKSPCHRLETSLSPDTRYYWSVRAHFKLNGRPCLTQWSLAGYALLNEAVPNVSCLRLRTPKSKQQNQ